MEDILNLVLQCPNLAKTIHNIPPEVRTAQVSTVTRKGMETTKLCFDSQQERFFSFITEFSLHSSFYLIMKPTKYILLDYKYTNFSVPI